MSLPVLQHPLDHSLNEPGRAGVASAATLNHARQEHHHQLRLRRERQIDEELVQSFPASDPPSWVQGTAPVRQ